MLREGRDIWQLELQIRLGFECRISAVKPHTRGSETAHEAAPSPEPRATGPLCIIFINECHFPEGRCTIPVVSSALARDQSAASIFHFFLLWAPASGWSLGKAQVALSPLVLQNVGPLSSGGAQSIPLPQGQQLDWIILVDALQLRIFRDSPLIPCFWDESPKGQVPHPGTEQIWGLLWPHAVPAAPPCPALSQGWSLCTAPGGEGGFRLNSLLFFGILMQGSATITRLCKTSATFAPQQNLPHST